MSDLKKVEGELPFGIVGTRVPAGIRRNGEYLEKLERSGYTVYLLSRHVEYEMSRVDLETGAHFALALHVAAYQSFYLLEGELVCLPRHERIGPGSSFRLAGDITPLHFEASCPTALLYFSTGRDFWSF